MQSGETRHQNTTQSIAVVQGRDDKGINEGGTASWKDFEKQQKGGMTLRNIDCKGQPEGGEPATETKQKWSERQKEKQTAVLESKGEESAEGLKAVPKRGQKVVLKQLKKIMKS